MQGDHMLKDDHIKINTAMDAFFTSLLAKNRSDSTIRAYRTDLALFWRWLAENTLVEGELLAVTRTDITEYLAELGQQELSGVTRARRLTAIREFFRFHTAVGTIPRDPSEGIVTPKQERRTRTWLSTDEYSRMLAAASGSLRDVAILQVFLQTGIRVSELVALTVNDIDLRRGVLTVRDGKGLADREIDLEKKGVAALKNWTEQRKRLLTVVTDTLFVNRFGAPLTERSVRRLVVKYRQLASIPRAASCHSLRHTFATYKLDKGVSLRQIQDWLGHRNLNTTQIYLHLNRQNAKRQMEATSL
jgi:site-specific recombinase XerD